MRLLYAFFLRFYVLGIRTAAIWNRKAREWVDGRSQVWNEVSDFKLREVPRYWFHCASLGEFEQGRPLMEAFKARGDCQLVVTFFSPSGYRIRKNFELADAVFYLPIDTKNNARKFIGRIQPTSSIFVKYEFWPNYILTCSEQHIPIWSVSARFRANQIFFRWYGGFMRAVLRSINGIFVQDAQSEILLKGIGISSVIAGDTRYDRVLNNASTARQMPEVNSFAGDKKVLICGSVWPEDMEILAPLINGLGADWKVIIAPHEIDDPKICMVEKMMTKSVSRHSAMNPNCDILIIDNVGMLMHLYQFGTVAYIGGAFRTGLHNILEPAAFGLPAIFGPRHDKFPEAKQFIAAGIGFSVSSVEELTETFGRLAIASALSPKVMEFMKRNRGATEFILERMIASTG